MMGAERKGGRAEVGKGGEAGRRDAAGCRTLALRYR